MLFSVGPAPTERELLQKREPVFLKCSYRTLGDQLCFIGAARHFARARPDVEVFVSNFPDLVAAYGDNLLNSGTQGREILCEPAPRHRIKNRSCDANYVGTYLAELGLTFGAPPALELPSLEPIPGLIPKAYACLQPYSGFAGIPANREAFFNTVVQAVRLVFPQWPISCVGLQNTRRDIRGVTYEHLGNHMTLLRAIQHSGMVLTPRSASAHVASAYGVPAFVWIPDDGENWHLDYPEWPHFRVAMDLGSDELLAHLIQFLERLRSGISSRPKGIANAP
jgi:hypothetical protein